MRARAIHLSGYAQGRPLVFHGGGDGLLHIPDYTGNVHCFDAVTGERHWVRNLGGKDWGSSAFVADGKVCVGTEANVLWVFRAGRETEVLSRTRLKTTPITPTASSGVLYIPTQKSLIAIRPSWPRRRGCGGRPR